MDVNASLLPASGDGGPVFALFFVILIVAAVASLFKRGQRKDNLKAAAERFHGAVVPSFWSGDRIEFEIDGIPAHVTYHAGSKNQSAYTRIRFRHTPAGLLRVAPEGLFASLRKIFGAQDIDTGEPAFDRAFLIQGSPEAWVREVLDAPTRRLLSRLSGMSARFLQGNHVSLEAGPGGVTLFCNRNFVNDRALLDAFLDQAIDVFRQVRTPVTEGIKILSAEEHAGRGECPVCASPLKGSLRRCPTCGTPHHPDCWEYFGGCAIYGCARRGGRP